MTSQCSWCVSPMRQAVEEAIEGGQSVSETARNYGLSRAQWKHHRLHGTVTAPSALARVRVEVLEGGGGPYTVIPRLESLLAEVAGLKEKWNAKPQIVVSLLRLERDILGDVAKLRGEFPDKPQMSLDQLPQWPIILAVLDEHPKARRHIVEALNGGH